MMSEAAHDDTPPVDMDFIRAITEDDRGFTRKLFTTFLSDVETGSSRLEKAMNPFSGATVRGIAHSFVGTAACLGAETLRARARELQDQAGALRFQESQEAYALFRIELERTAEFVKVQLGEL